MEPNIDEDGNKFWLNENGVGDREDGPAIIWADGSEYWYKNGQRHRADGPAIECSNGYIEWWSNGNYYSNFETWLEDLNVSLEEKILLKLRYV